MSRFRIPGGIGYQGHYPLGSIQDGTSVRTNSNAPSSFQYTVANLWDDLTYEAKAKIASAGVDINRLMAVAKAVRRAQPKVAPMLVAELGVRVEELLAGVIPGLLIMLCCVVSTTALGAAAGGALGFLLGGVGAAPGAVLGGTIGFEAGIALLTWLGLAFLVAHVAKDLGTAITKAIDGIKTAWNAGNRNGAALDLRIDFAATQLASAVVHLFLSIVNALIAYITKGAATSSANNVKAAVSEAALAEAIAKINKSKILGKTVGAWFKKNYQAIIDHRSRKTARPSDSPKPPEQTMTPSQVKKLREEAGSQKPPKTNGVVARYGPMNEGPLPKKYADTFRSSTYSEVVTQKPTTLYRTYGGSAGKLGGYWTPTKPSGPVQSIIDSALDPKWGNIATEVVKIEVPTGTRYFEGIAAPQGGLVGGGPQVLFPPGFKVDPNWIKK